MAIYNKYTIGRSSAECTMLMRVPHTKGYCTLSAHHAKRTTGDQSIQYPERLTDFTGECSGKTHTISQKCSFDIESDTSDEATYFISI